MRDRALCRRRGARHGPLPLLDVPQAPRRPFATMARSLSRRSRWTAGEDAIVRYESSPGFHRSFCRTCGSSLPDRSPSGGWFVPAGLFADDPGVRPSSTSSGLRARPGTRSRMISRGSTLAAAPGHAGDRTPAGRRSGRTGRTPGKLPLRRHRLRGDRALRACPQLPLLAMPARARRRPHHERVHVLRRNAFVRGETARSPGGCPMRGSSPTPSAGPAARARRAATRPRNLDHPLGIARRRPGRGVDSHIFVGSRAPWYEFQDGLPTHDEMPS